MLEKCKTTDDIRCQKRRNNNIIRRLINAIGALFSYPFYSKTVDVALTVFLEILFGTFVFADLV